MKMRNTMWLVAVVVGLLMSVSLASAAGEPLPITKAAGTTFTATVSEQADVTVPAMVTFTVNDVTDTTPAPAATVSATSIVLTNLHTLKISLTADATTFSKMATADTTWDAADVSWNAASWTTGTGNAASLSATVGTYTEVVTSAANAPTCSSTDLTFTLAAKAAADPAIMAGDHTLACTWKFESL